MEPLSTRNSYMYTPPIAGLVILSEKVCEVIFIEIVEDFLSHHIYIFPVPLASFSICMFMFFIIIDFGIMSVVFYLMYNLYVCQLLIAKILLAGALRSIFIFGPFISFQAYGYLNMCMGRSVAEMRPWCKARLPLLYNYIQSRYWYVTHIIHSTTLCLFCLHWYCCCIICRAK